MKEAQQKVALRALMAAPDEWRRPRHFHDPNIHPDIGFLAFGVCINKIYHALEPLGVMDRRKATGVAGWEIKFSPVNEWKKLINKDFEAAAEQLYAVVKRWTADGQKAAAARMKKANEIVDEMADDIHAKVAAKKAKPLNVSKEQIDKLNDTLLNRLVDELVPELFKRIDERVEERVKLTEQGLTNLQDQLTQDRENVEDEYVQEQNLNIRVTFGWDK